MPRPRHIISGLVLAAVVAASSLSGPATAQTPPSGSYLNTFDQYVPTDPLPLGSGPDMDVHVHSRDRETWAGLEPMTMHHGSHCEAPPATHQSPNPMPYEQAVFLCSANPHVMTSIKASGYGLIYMTPSAQADFSRGEAVIRADVSTLAESGRDWWDIWITPYQDNLVNPLDDWLPDLYGAPRRSVHVRKSANGSFGAEVSATSGGTTTVTPIPAAWWLAYEQIITPSAVRRDTFEVKLSRTHLTVSLLNSATGAPMMTWVDANLPVPLDWDRGVVQFGHHSYTPEKDCANPGTTGCRAGTWHWDNLSIRPAVPITMRRATERAALAASPGAPMAFTFAQPSPENAHLRVAAVGDGYQYSVDGGISWATLTRQTAEKSAPDPGHAESYWQPIPAGVTAVQLKTTVAGWWGQDMVEHVAIWAEGVQQIPSPTALPPTSTPIPTDSPTPAPVTTSTPLPTFTPVPQPPTVTAIVAATNTAVAATVTAIATLAGTPAPLTNCTVTVASNGKTGSWSCP